MNKFLNLSIEYANQKSYLDDLFKVYPTIPNGIRDVNKKLWNVVEQSFNRKDNLKLVSTLLDFDLFPIKDSYVAFLKRDRSSIERNPQTINRLAGELYDLGLTKIYENCTLPKETNRQIGPMFKQWIQNKSLGIEPKDNITDFITNEKENAILNVSDGIMKQFAKDYLDYKHDKGLDFVARFNGKYIIGEAKFLTDFGGHQNAQFNDAMTVLNTESKAIKIAILDGVCYIKGRNKMYKQLTEIYKDYNVMSSLVLRNFLYQI
ncbi:MAG: restriction endonuclease [Bacteroidales bacterium]|nr:restriction endonuclease [Bacteroidales bacterium]MBQ9255498.1 restriction endonuclease [Bacteroidales bacterium]